MDRMLLPPSRARRTLLATSAIGLAVARALLSADSARSAQLPVPCGPGSCAANNTPGFTAPAGFVTSGKATGVQKGNTFTVSQASNQAILNWASFNVSADGKVIFNQPG